MKVVRSRSELREALAELFPELVPLYEQLAARTREVAADSGQEER